MRSLMFACVAGVASAIASGLLAGQVDIVLKQPSGDWQQSGVGEIRHLAFSPNGKILYAANDRAVAWNLETQECLGVSPMLLEHVRVLPSGHPQRMGR